MAGLFGVADTLGGQVAKLLKPSEVRIGHIIFDLHQQWTFVILVVGLIFSSSNNYLNGDAIICHGGRDYINNFCPQLVEELEILWRVGRKAEIQQVLFRGERKRHKHIFKINIPMYQVSEEREPGFLAKTFLPSKLLHLEHLARNGAQLF